MSRKGITKENYPNFNVVMRYMWLTYYQPYCLARFYRYQNRYKNEYAEPSSEKDIYEKYQMFNEKHSRSLKPNEDWHFEFRGYGEMLSGWKEDSGAAKEYMRVLMNMWLYAIDYYDKFKLREWDRIEIEKRDEPVDKENDEDLQNILYEFIRTPGMGETYQDKVNTFLKLFRTHLWYALKRKKTPLVKGTLWKTKGLMIRVVYSDGENVQYIFEDDYEEQSYSPLSVSSSKVDKFRSQFRFNGFPKVEKGSWWIEKSTNNITRMRNNLGKYSSTLDKFYASHTYGGHVSVNDLWNIDGRMDGGVYRYNVIRVNKVINDSAELIISSLDGSINNEKMPLIDFFNRAIKLNRPPVTEGDIWTDRVGYNKEILSISKISETLNIPKLDDIDVGGWTPPSSREKFLQEYTFHRHRNYKERETPEKGSKWRLGNKIATVEGVLGSYMINLTIDNKFVQMGLTAFFTETEVSQRMDRLVTKFDLKF
jgi:hypothetical protein